MPRPHRAPSPLPDPNPNPRLPFFLQRLIGGDDADVDVADLRRHVKYCGGYNDLSPTVRDLWAVLSEASPQERGLFLKFVTSCSKPPLGGFAHMHPSFTIQCVSSDGNEVPSVLAFFGMGRRETITPPSDGTCARFSSFSLSVSALAS